MSGTIPPAIVDTAPNGDRSGSMNMKKTVHLLCNSHIDPVWLWRWEEGAAEALSTFRAAADFCEEYNGFVFNHNEAILYEWVEEYEPALFERIRRLVKAGRWHIMGGWYLQPDCNMPSGESFVRQILLGKRYFRSRFDVDITTGVNLDPFGHSRGLVQILARSGYDSYLFCRPPRDDCPAPDDAFTWVGFDGSQITATLASAHYNSAPGGARSKVEAWLRLHPDRPCSLLAWGVGNHGGGPSRRDLDDLAALIRDISDFDIIHSTPERYFDDLHGRGVDLSPLPRDLNPWAVGCYTSMMGLKEKHRRLENALFMTEKMATTAALHGLMPYPRADLRDAGRDLATSEFHDALPGSSIEPVEDATIQLLDHGLEILDRVKARAFFALCAGQPLAHDGALPILVYNPHPYKFRTIIECELQPQWPHGTDGYLQPTVSQGSRTLPTQPEKPHSNINEDHRKRVVFRATLKPSCVNRFDCRLRMQASPPRITLRQPTRQIHFKTADLDVIINSRTGLMDRYRVRGVDYLKPGAFRPLVMFDNADPWGMTVQSFRKLAGRFTLMSARQASELSAVAADSMPAVRIIEDGPVRTVVEAMFTYGRSYICQRYKLPREGTEFEIDTRVHWCEKDSMLKLSIPTTIAAARCLGQVAYGTTEFPPDGREVVAHKWVASISRDSDMALTCINDAVHGFDFSNDELRLSLLRSPAYAAHPVGDRSITAQDRYIPRMDQGVHNFRFWINAGPCSDRLDGIDREAASKAEACLRNRSKLKDLLLSDAVHFRKSDFMNSGSGYR